MRRRVLRRAVAAGVLAAVACCAVGVPLPAVVVKPHDERYPCEHHACGCADAEACWRDCCCMSQGEKLAWAKRAGVTPPDYVVAAAGCEAADELRASGAGRGDQGEPAGCCVAEKRSCRSCCDRSHDKGEAATEAARAHRPGIRIVLLHAALKCRGLTMNVSLLPPSLPAAASDFLPPLVERRAAAAVESPPYDSPTLLVESPPPDAARA